MLKAAAGQTTFAQTGNDAHGRRDSRILNSIRQIIRAIDIDSRKLAAEHKITSPQLMCLLAIVEQGVITAAEIARRVHLSASTLVGMLDRLEAKGYIHRDRSAEDRREVQVGATDAGRALASKIPFPTQYSLARAMKQLSDNEQEQLAAWMERLVDLMGAGEVYAGPMLEIGAIHGHQRLNVTQTNGIVPGQGHEEGR